jgi:hypothetical protein
VTGIASYRQVSAVSADSHVHTATWRNALKHWEEIPERVHRRGKPSTRKVRVVARDSLVGDSELGLESAACVPRVHGGAYVCACHLPVSVPWRSGKVRDLTRDRACVPAVGPFVLSRVCMVVRMRVQRSLICQWTCPGVVVECPARCGVILHVPGPCVRARGWSPCKGLLHSPFFYLL